MMKSALVIICFLIGLQAQAQLSGRERADSIRDANRARLDSIREANLKRTDSIKLMNQLRRDSLELVKQARLNKSKSAKKKSNSEVTEIVDEKALLKERLEAKRDSIALEREKATERRKEENLAKQNSRLLNKKEIEKPISQELSLGYRLASDGWGFFMTRGFIKTEDADNMHTFFIWADISEKKNPKEIQSMNENFIVANPNEIKPVGYKYGKINNFYTLKFGVGNSKPLTGLLDKRSIAISWTYQAGLSIGMLKPYYLDVLIPEGNVFVRRIEKYSKEIEDSFLDLKNQGTIVGGGDFTKGLNEIKLQPGLLLRSGFYFDYTPTKYTYLGVEIGASLEAYTQKIPIMINTENKAVFFNIYADVRFGKRWN